MSADRLMSWLWFIVAALYGLRIVAALAAGRGALADTVPMLTALAHAAFYTEDSLPDSSRGDGGYGSTGAM